MTRPPRRPLSIHRSPLVPASLAGVLAVTACTAESNGTKESAAITEQADLWGDLANGALDIAVFVASLAAANPEAGAIAVGALKLGVDGYTIWGDVTASSGGTTADDTALKKAVADLQLQTLTLSSQVQGLSAALTADTTALASYGIQIQLAMFIGAQRVLADNSGEIGSPGQSQTSHQILQAQLDDFEPQIVAMESFIWNPPPSIRPEALQFLRQAYSFALLVRYQYALAGFPMTRDWLGARCATLYTVGAQYPGGTTTDGGAKFAQFRNWFWQIARPILWPYTSVRGVADYTGDGNADLLMHDVVSGSVVIVPLSAGLQARYTRGQPVSVTTLASGSGIAPPMDATGDGVPDVIVEDDTQGPTGGNRTLLDKYGNALPPTPPMQNLVGWTPLASNTFPGFPRAGFTQIEFAIGSPRGSFSYSLMWQTPSFVNQGWYTQTYAAYYPAISGSLVPAQGIADFNGDGLLDPVFLTAGGSGISDVSMCLSAPPSAPNAYDDIEACNMQTASQAQGIIMLVRPISAVVGVADFDHDGHPDLLVQETALPAEGGLFGHPAEPAALGVWYMNGTTVVATRQVSLACQPIACAAGACGVMDNGCGVPLDCGGCGTGFACSQNACSCVPTTPCKIGYAWNSTDCQCELSRPPPPPCHGTCQ